MDQRTKNRHREHDEHGLYDTGLENEEKQPGRTLWKCPLDDWWGWLDKE